MTFTVELEDELVGRAMEYAESKNLDDVLERALKVLIYMETSKGDSSDEKGGSRLFGRSI